jgi:tRNA U34 2-thiouridine synthase MnmA/TrmU
VPLDNATLHRAPELVQTVRLRYHAEPLACRVHVQDDGSIELELDQVANGVAPGQLACLMRQDRVVGEGTIGEPR